MTRLVEKERELAALQEHAAESSTRIETIVEDIRDALGTLPDASPEALAALTSRVGSTAAGLTSWQVVSSGSKPCTSTRSRPS